MTLSPATPARLAAVRRLNACVDELGLTLDQRGLSPEAFYLLASRALRLEALAELRDRLLDILKVPDKLFRVHVELVTGATPQCRASLQLTDAGRHLAAALGARNVDPLVVEEAIGHPDLSCVSQPGADAESPAGETPPAAKRSGAGQ